MNAPAFTAKTALDFLGYGNESKGYILDMYNMPHRKYHDERHLDNILRWINPDYKLIKPLLEAILFHDIVYSDQLVPPGYNEAASVALFSLKKLEQVQHSDVDVSDILVPVQAINATAHHEEDQKFINEVTMLTLDLDLQSFAQPREEFLLDCDLVRQEFEPIVGNKLFLKGSKAFLQKMLKRKKLYYVVQDWEAKARANLEWRIDNMEARP